jgi:hypothetical protein
MSLLIAWMCAVCVGGVLALFGVGMAAAIIAGVVGITVLVARGAFPQRFDDLYTDSEIWLFDHPVVYVGLYAAIGLIATVWSPALQGKLVAVAIWGVAGWFNLRRWRRRVAAVRASR